MKKKILFIAHDSSLYGANQSLVNMISSLKDKPYDISVALPNSGPISKYFDDLKITYYILNYRNEIFGKNFTINDLILNKLRFYYKIYKNYFALREFEKLHTLHKFDFVHSNSSVVAIGELFAKKNRIKHIWHIREYIDLDHKANVYGGILNYKLRIQNSDEVVCITKDIAAHFEIKSKAFILRDAVRKKTLRTYKESKSDYFLFCGSLQKEKVLKLL